MKNLSSLNCNGLPKTSSFALHPQKHGSTHEAVPASSKGTQSHRISQRCHKEDDPQRCAIRNGLRKLKDKISSNDEASYVSLNRSDPYSYSGSKRALLCGVTYENKSYRLKGPVNDVKKMKEFLLQYFYYLEESIVVLTEKEDVEKFKPTKRNIQNAFKWLVKRLQKDSSLVFYYTGHGHRQLDLDNDEHDGFDETICPMDYEEAGMILDDEINDAIVRPLTKGVKLHAIIDSCHSGTMLDLTYVYEKKKKDTSKWIDNSPPLGTNKRTSGGSAICISACSDAQLAADTTAFSKKEMGGVLTYNLIAAVKRNPDNIAYGDLLSFLQESFPKIYGSNKLSRMLRKVFRAVFVQDPQLSSSENFDIFADIIYVHII